VSDIAIIRKSSQTPKSKARRRVAGLHHWMKIFYAAFFSCPLTLAHLARCAAAIFLRAEIERVRFGAVALAFVGDTG
jgi:hypothetical protein